MKKLSVYLLLAATMLIPNLAFAESGEMSLLFNYSSMDYEGKYDKYWPSDLDTVKNSEKVIRLGFEIYPVDRFALGIDLSYFGKNEYDNPTVPAFQGSVKKESESVFGTGIFGRINLIDVPFSGETSRFRLYGKGGIGYYMRDISVTAYKANISKWKEDSAIDAYTGFFYSAGAELVLNPFIIGVEYRYDKTFSDFKKDGANKYWEIEAPAFEASQIGVNVGLRFGGSGSSSSGSNWDSTASQNSFENPTINNNVQQVNNSGWGALGDNSNVAADAPTESVQPAETGVAAVKERSEEAMKELDQMSAKNAGTDPVLDKDKFLKKMDKIWNDLDSGAIKEEIAIPSFGILFKIGKSDILPYYNEMLNDFVDLYKKTDGNAKILIEGYSSNNSNKSTGRKSETLFNPSLSQQRVKAVAKYLVKEGIPASNLELKAYRNTKVSSGMFDNDPDCDTNCYRRVNISIK